MEVVIDDLCDLTLAEARRQLDDRKIDPTDLVSACLARLERTEPTLRAWTTIDREGAIARAADLTRQHPEGPLWGIPVGVKDIIDVAGLPTTAGSRILAGNIATSDAPVVSSLKSAGAVILGKTNTHEFAYGASTPPTTNPWDPGCIPGGSSGGSAAALAVSGCLGALGSDTAGSIRIPAALCGITGLKPAYGATSTAGVIPLAPTFDVVGPMARTAEDLVLMWQGLVGGSEGGDGGFRMALPYEGMLPELDAEVAKAVQQATDLLESLAQSTFVMDRDSPSFYEFDFPRSLVLMSEALEVHRSNNWWPQHQEEYTEETRSYLEYATRWSESSAGANYDETLALVRDLGQKFSSSLDATDVLATPAVPRPAPTHKESRVVDDGSPRRPVVIDLTRIPAIANVTGLAALSLPCGFTSAGLPVGLQLLGRDERLLLSIGVAYQKQTDWHLRRPPIVST